MLEAPCDELVIRVVTRSGRLPRLLPIALWFKMQAKFVKSGAVAVVQLAVEKAICVELFSDVPQLGRFTLRDEGRTIAVGKIVKLPKST